MKKNEWKNRYICLFSWHDTGDFMYAFSPAWRRRAFCMFTDLIPASASLISPEFSRSTHTSAEELTGIRQVSVRLEADQRLRQNGMTGTELVIIMLAVLLANTVFYKEKKRLLTINDADGRRFIICYIHHQDGQKH